MKRNELMQQVKALIKRGLESDLDFTRDMTDYLMRKFEINKRIDLRKIKNDDLYKILFCLDDILLLGA